MLGSAAFQKCERLRRVTFQDESQLERVGRKCFNGSGIAEVRTPQSLKRIDSSAFQDCKNLKRAVLNEGLTQLGEEDYSGVFDSSGLESVVLPSTLKRLEESTFGWCEQLKRI